MRFFRGTELLLFSRCWRRQWNDQLNNWSIKIMLHNFHVPNSKSITAATTSVDRSAAPAGASVSAMEPRNLISRHWLQKQQRHRSRCIDKLTYSFLRFRQQHQQRMQQHSGLLDPFDTSSSNNSSGSICSNNKSSDTRRLFASINLTYDEMIDQRLIDRLHQLIDRSRHSSPS